MRQVIAIALFGLTIGFFHFAHAAPPFEDVRVEMKVITVPQNFALSMTAAIGRPLSAKEMRDLDALIAKGGAEMEALLTAHTLSGNLVNSETIEELRYPIEWNQRAMPGGSFGPKPPPGKFSHYVAPTIIESRGLGFDFEAEAIAHRDGKFIDVNCQSKRTRLDGWTRTAATFAESGLAISFPNPRFAEQSLTARITLPSGKWAVVGTFKEKGEPPRIQLRLLRATVRSPKSNL